MSSKVAMVGRALYVFALVAVTVFSIWFAVAVLFVLSGANP